MSLLDIVSYLVARDDVRVFAMRKVSIPERSVKGEKIFRIGSRKQDETEKDEKHLLISEKKFIFKKLLPSFY